MLCMQPINMDTPQQLFSNASDSQKFMKVGVFWCSFLWHFHCNVTSLLCKAFLSQGAKKKK